MSEMISTLDPRYSHGTWRRRHPHLLRALLAPVLAVVVVAIATSMLDVIGSTPAESVPTAGAVTDFPARELPPEWRWEPQSVEVEHMYREGAEPRPTRKWIR